MRHPFLRKLWAYLTFQKANEGKETFNIKVMHGINRISVILFTGALIVMIIRWISRH